MLNHLLLYTHIASNYTYLGCLGFASACGASRGPSKLQVEGPRQGEVAAVGEGGDHQTSRVPKVFITIDKLSIDCSHQHLILPVVAGVCVHVHVCDMCVCVCMCACV